MTLEQKKDLIAKIAAELEQELDLLRKAATASKEASIHEESRAEDSHDTRSTEAGYLAAGQAQRTADVEGQVKYFRTLEPIDFSRGKRIAAGAWVQLRQGTAQPRYFLAVTGGGRRVDGVQVLSTVSPLGEALLGAQEGETLEWEMGGRALSAEILKVVLFLTEEAACRVPRIPRE
jgi:transcription elongation GreA/GreB family factor